MVLEIIGLLASLLIGISLGLIGGGGSILTVPVLVYLLGVNPVLATSYSLFIVGSTSLMGVLPKFRKGLVSIPTAVAFGIPSILAVYATRQFLVPLIPEQVFTIGDIVVTKPKLMLLLFAILMVFASYSLMSKKRQHKRQQAEWPQTFNYPMILLQGIIVGIVTGLVGAGGGFIIIPALVLFARLPMKQAVGTSLLIIAANSIVGFIGDHGHYDKDLKLMGMVTLLAITGIFIGNGLSHKIPGEKLKRGFGYFVLVMGLFIIIKEIFFS